MKQELDVSSVTLSGSSEKQGAAEAKPAMFTLVFEGDLRKFPGNFFKVDTPFGKPVAAGLGNAFDEIDRPLHQGEE
jgi:hypothetical protein